MINPNCFICGKNFGDLKNKITATHYGDNHRVQIGLVGDSFNGIYVFDSYEIFRINNANNTYWTEYIKVNLNTNTIHLIMLHKAIILPEDTMYWKDLKQFKNYVDKLRIFE